MTLSTVSTGDVIQAADIDQMVNWLKHFAYNIYDSGLDNTGATGVSSGMQAIIDEAQSTNKIAIGIPPGIYLIDTPLTVSYPIKLVCLGPWGSATFKLANGVNDYILKFTPAVSNVIVGGSIVGLTFDGNNSTQSAGGCILGSGSVHWSYDFCHFLNPYDIALRLTNVPAQQIGHHNRVTRCLFDGGSTSAGNGKGLQLDSSDENYVSLCDFENLGGAGSEPYALKDWSGIQKIIGNVFVGGAEGIRIQDASSTRIIGNTFDGVGRAGIHMSGSKNVVLGNLFSNGSSASNGAYAQVEIDNSSSAVVNGNSFTVNTTGVVRNCIRELSSSSHTTIVDGNVIDLSGGTLYGGNKAVELAGTDSKATNNPGWNPVGPITAPGMPTTTTPLQNTSGGDVTIYLTGGTVTAIAIGNTSGSQTATGMTSGPIHLGAGQWIKLTYTGSPTWTWFLE